MDRAGLGQSLPVGAPTVGLSTEQRLGWCLCTATAHRVSAWRCDAPPALQLRMLLAITRTRFQIETLLGRAFPVKNGEEPTEYATQLPQIFNE